jgi:hypothetical protein
MFMLSTSEFAAEGAAPPILEALVPIDFEPHDVFEQVVGLVDSVHANWTGSTKLELTVVTPTTPPPELTSLFRTTRQFSVSFLTATDDFGVDPDSLGERIYWKRVVALAFASRCRAPFYLVLDTRSFCLRAFEYASLLPRGRARTHWEPSDLHPEAHANAARLLGVEATAITIPSIAPVVYSTAIARRCLQRIAGASGQSAVAALMKLSSSSVEWSDNSVYALSTIGGGVQLDDYHFVPEAEGDETRSGLRSEIDVWDDEVSVDWSPRRWREQHGTGLFVTVSPPSRAVRLALLERCYAALVPPPSKDRNKTPRSQHG